MPRYVKEITFRGHRPDSQELPGFHVVVGEYTALGDGRVVDLRDQHMTMEKAQAEFGTLAQMVDTVTADGLNKVAAIRDDKAVLEAEIDALKAEKVALVKDAETIPGEPGGEEVVAPMGLLGGTVEAEAKWWQVWRGWA